MSHINKYSELSVFFFSFLVFYKISEYIIEIFKLNIPNEPYSYTIINEIEKVSTYQICKITILS